MKGTVDMKKTLIAIFCIGLAVAGIADLTRKPLKSGYGVELQGTTTRAITALPTNGYVTSWSVSVTNGTPLHILVNTDTNTFAGLFATTNCIIVASGTPYTFREAVYGQITNFVYQTASGTSFWHAGGEGQ